jgi:hypothetical protein
MQKRNSILCADDQVHLTHIELNAGDHKLNIIATVQHLYCDNMWQKYS